MSKGNPLIEPSAKMLAGDRSGLVLTEPMARRLLKFIGCRLDCSRCVQFDECHDQPEDGEFLAVCSLEDVDMMPLPTVYSLIKKFAGGDGNA